MGQFHRVVDPDEVVGHQPEQRDPVEVAPVRGFGSKSAVEDVLRISAGKIGTVFDIGATIKSNELDV